MFGMLGEAVKADDGSTRSGRAHPTDVSAPVDLQEDCTDGLVDTVLIDAPCSRLGILRRGPGSRWELSPALAVHLRKSSSPTSATSHVATSPSPSSSAATPESATLPSRAWLGPRMKEAPEDLGRIRMRCVDIGFHSLQCYRTLCAFNAGFCLQMFVVCHYPPLQSAEPCDRQLFDVKPSCTF